MSVSLGVIKSHTLFQNSFAILQSHACWVCHVHYNKYIVSYDGSWNRINWHCLVVKDFDRMWYWKECNFIFVTLKMFQMYCSIWSKSMESNSVATYWKKLFILVQWLEMSILPQTVHDAICAVREQQGKSVTRRFFQQQKQVASSKLQCLSQIQKTSTLDLSPPTPCRNIRNFGLMRKYQ